MTEGANAELTRKAFAALGEGGVDAMLPYVHPDGEMITPSDMAAEPDTYRGHDGVRRYFDAFYEVMDRVDVDLLSVEELEDGQVVAKLRLMTRGRATGIESGIDAYMLCGFEDGKMRLMRFFVSREAALAAAGG